MRALRCMCEVSRRAVVSRRWHSPMNRPPNGSSVVASDASLGISSSSFCPTSPVTKAMPPAGLRVTSRSGTGDVSWVVFVGDDVTDEDAFSAIERGISVLVGSRESAATYQLGSTAEVNALLAWLTRER